MKKYPSLVFANLHYAGSSAIDPILRDILPLHGYDLVFGPERSYWFPFFAEATEGPLYHWTHSSVERFASQIGRSDYRFLYLYRDPRDVLISWTKDCLFRGLHPGLAEREILVKKIEEEFEPFLLSALDWIALSDSICLKFTFEEMKKDIPGMICKILRFLGIEGQERIVSASWEKHRFESVTGRDRGQGGRVIRTGYYFRKGVAGDWKNYFDEEIKRKFKHRLGSYLVQLGYELGNDW